LQKEKSPAEGPPGIIALLQKQIAEIVLLPDFKATLDKLSFQPVGSTSAEFGNQIKNDIVVWSKVMKDANIPVN
jgi:tripartite-type tricarboxylate transporter receptor subunit TctC